MSYRVVIIAPPSHFPVGLDEFLEEIPRSTIEIYHPHYAQLEKFFFGLYLKDLLLDYPRIVIHCESEPKNQACDLYIEVGESPPLNALEKKFWPLSQGSVDLLEFLPRREAPSLRTKEHDWETRNQKKDYDLSWWDLYEEPSWGTPRE